MLIKSLCKNYFTVQLHYHTKKVKDSLTKSKLRNLLTILITFLGQ